MEISKYKEMVINHFKPFFTTVDVGHGLVHVMEVMELALKMNQRLRLELSEYDIIVASIAHDIYSYTDRDEHHTKAKEYVLNDTGDIYDYVDNKEHIACAIGEHRASFNGMHTSKLSELLSAADRGEPDLGKIIKRIYACAIDPILVFDIDKKGIPNIALPNGKLLREMYDDLISAKYNIPFIKTYVHLCVKYGVYGYAKYNAIYKQAFSTKLCSMWLEIDKIAMYPDILLDYLDPTIKYKENNES